MFWNLVLFAVSFIGSALLAPKPKIENARASSLSDFNFPRSDEGAPIIRLLGKGMIRGPNSLWYGDFEARPIVEKVRVSLFKKMRVVVGHEYFIGLDLGLSIGPITLHRIVANEDKTLFEGNLTTSVLNQALTPLDIGGYKKGGTISGTFSFYSGTATEARDDYVHSKLPAELQPLLPNYRGLGRVVFNRIAVGEAPNLPQLGFVASCLPDPLGLGAKNSYGEGINPSSALYTIFSAKFGGLGMNGTNLNAASFIAAANTLFDEGHAMTLVAAQSDAAKEFVDEILRQIDAVIYEDAATRETGIKLIRADYDPDTIPHFGADETLEVVSYDRGFWGVTHNEVRVNYTSPDRNYQTATAFAQDPAAIGRAGKVKPVELSFPMCVQAEIAQAIAQRELRERTTPLIKTRVIFNRTAAKLRAGDVFKWSFPERGIANLILRIERIDHGTLEDGRIAIDAVQDVYGVGSLVFAPPVTGRFVAPQTQPVPIVERAVIECPRFLVERFATDGIAPDGSGRVLAFLGAKPSLASTYFAAEVQGTLAVSDLDFAPRAALTLPVTIASSTIRIGGASFTPSTFTAAQLAAGSGVILVGGVEWMQYTAATNNGDGTFTLSVLRGRFQTPRVAHAVNAVVLALDTDIVPTDFEPRTEASVPVKLLPTTFSGTLSSSSAPADSVALTGRNSRPNAPVITTAAATLPAAATTVALAWKARTDKGKTSIALPADPADAYPSGEFAIVRHSINGGAVTETSFPVGASSGSITFPATPGGTLSVEIYGARGTGAPADRSLEFDLVQFALT